MKKKIICFDIDGVICKTFKNNYKNSKPIKKNIKLINYLYEQNYYIKIFTARYMGRSNDSIAIATNKAKKITIKQLDLWGVKYHQIRFGKPSYDIFVDDKSLDFKKNWNFRLLKKLNI